MIFTGWPWARDAIQLMAAIIQTLQQAGRLPVFVSPMKCHQQDRPAPGERTAHAVQGAAAMAPDINLDELGQRDFIASHEIIQGHPGDGRRVSLRKRQMRRGAAKSFVLQQNALSGGRAGRRPDDQDILEPIARHMKLQTPPGYGVRLKGHHLAVFAHVPGDANSV